MMVMVMMYLSIINTILNDDDIDARTLIDHARIEAQNHRFTFDEVIIHLYHM
jgi:hypothetical protein